MKSSVDFRVQSVDFRVKSAAYGYIADLIEQIERTMAACVDEDGNVLSAWESEYKAYQLALEHLKSFN